LNSLFVLLGIEHWKPALTALLLPPVPLLLIVLLGAWLAARRRLLGSATLLAGVALLWLSHCAVSGHWLSRWLLDPPGALGAQRIEALRADAGARKITAIVVLGGGSEPLAPEYGTSNLSSASVERLRYGVWLARATGLPVAFSGGIGWGGSSGAPEAQVAERIARAEFGLPLRWVEGESRDTRENAAHSVALLRRDGVKHIVLVTHDWHMPRALRDFRRSAPEGFSVEAAPMALANPAESPRLRWLPSGAGMLHVRRVWHEALGLLMGA
jgi:uncharacterized SAM-binding protein YcdF (DUF218 family)